VRGEAAILDTNILVRYLTGNPPAQARRATAFLAGATQLVLVDLVVAELVHVLESVYEQPRSRVAEATRSLLALPTVAVADLELLLRTIELYETLRLHFADAYLAANAELSGIGRVASFDRWLDRVDTIQRVEP
jgi:predicted nucleic acid-binding protein